jgi:hypothetical protein
MSVKIERQNDQKIYTIKEEDNDALKFGNKRGGNNRGLRVDSTQQRGGGRRGYQPRGGYDSSARGLLNNSNRGGIQCVVVRRD